MKIDLASINPDQFIMRDCVISGDDCVLVFPTELSVDWTPTNLHLRSVIARKSDGQVVSLAHRKFFNDGEKPDLYPNPLDHSDWRISTKLDGSLITVTKYRSELVIRTRGTSTIDIYETGAEVRALLKPLLNNAWRNTYCFEDTLCQNSFLFEHTTPSNIIVIPYSEPKLTLLDIVSHEDGRYWSAKQVDQMALCLGCDRPQVHQFNTLDEIRATLSTISDIEGYVLSYADNQHRIKLKGSDYLLRHRFKSRVTFSNLLDMFFAYGRPDVLAFLARIESEFDFESMEMAKQIVEQIDLAHRMVVDQIDEIEEGMMTNFMDLPSRREQALAIQMAYSDLWRGVAFKLLDKRPIDDKMMRKLIEAELDKGVTDTTLPA